MDCLHNRDAELSIIGTAITDTSCAVRLAAAPESLFSAADTRAAHKAIRKLVADGQQCDLITVEAIACADVSNVAEMLVTAAAMGYSAMYGQYEALLYGCAKRRTLRNVAQRILADVASPAADPEAMSASTIDALRATEGATSSVSMEDALMGFVSELQHAKEARCMSGISALDRIVGGFRGGQYIAVGARPGVGKTAFGFSVAVNIARKRGPVLFVSLEMKPEELMARLVSAESGVDGHSITTGNLNADEYVRMEATYPEISRIPMQITNNARTPAQIRREAVQMKHGGGLAAVVVDYIGLLDSDKPSSSRYEKISDISRELKLLAMDLDVPLLVLTQFNRVSEAGKGPGTNRPPTMSEARDSGSIEQDANVFIVLHSPADVPQANPGAEQWEAHCWCERNGWTRHWMIVEKNRSGRTGMATVGFDKAHMRYFSREIE